MSDKAGGVSSPEFRTNLVEIGDQKSLIVEFVCKQHKWLVRLLAMTDYRLYKSSSFKVAKTLQV